LQSRLEKQAFQADDKPLDIGQKITRVAIPLRKAGISRGISTVR